jgi:hypothetical protein
MSQIIGNIVIIAILAVVIGLALRKTISGFKSELRGEGCASCGSRSSCQSFRKNVSNKDKTAEGESATASCSLCCGSNSNYKPDQKAFKRFCKR